MNYGPYLVSWKLYKRIEEAIEKGATSDMEVWMYVQACGFNYPEHRITFEEPAVVEEGAAKRGQGIMKETGAKRRQPE